MNTHQLQHTTIPPKDHQNRFILSFSPKTSFVSKIFRTFAIFLQKLPLFPKYFVLLQRYLPLWLRNPNRRDEPLGGALHIEKALLTLCFWIFET